MRRKKDEGSVSTEVAFYGSLTHQLNKRVAVFKKKRSKAIGLRLVVSKDGRWNMSLNGFPKASKNQKASERFQSAKGSIWSRYP